MKKKRTTTRYVHFGEQLCTGCANCLKACPTRAIRIRDSKSIRLVERCIGCGECIRVCPTGAATAATGTLDLLDRDRICVALVTPVLYAQFPGVMPNDILLGLKLMGFQHTVDMSYALEMFQDAAEEFIIRNRKTHQAPWPLISPVCPVVIRLMAFKFPSLLPHVLPLLRPVDLIARDVKKRVTQQYGISADKITLYYINPCPTKLGPVRRASRSRGTSTEIAIGIKDIYADLMHQLEKIRQADQLPFVNNRFDIEYCHTGNGLMWTMSGGEIADMSIEDTLAVSGLQETITYLEKIEMGLFRNLEYIELRTCREGCLGGAITAIDKYLAKRAVTKMIKTLGLGRRLSRQIVLRLYEKGDFLANQDPARLIRLFGAHKEPLSIESVQKIDTIVDRIQGKDCSICGAPDCQTFAEDVVSGWASLDDCLVLRSQEKKDDPSGGKEKK